MTTELGVASGLSNILKQKYPKPPKAGTPEWHEWKMDTLIEMLIEVRADVRKLQRQVRKLRKS